MIIKYNDVIPYDYFYEGDVEISVENEKILELNKVNKTVKAIGYGSTKLNFTYRNGAGNKSIPIEVSRAGMKVLIGNNKYKEYLVNRVDENGIPIIDLDGEEAKVYPFSFQREKGNVILCSVRTENANYVGVNEEGLLELGVDFTDNGIPDENMSVFDRPTTALVNTIQFTLWRKGTDTPIPTTEYKIKSINDNERLVNSIDKGQDAYSVKIANIFQSVYKQKVFRFKLSSADGVDYGEAQVMYSDKTKEQLNQLFKNPDVFYSDFWKDEMRDPKTYWNWREDMTLNEYLSGVDSGANENQIGVLVFEGIGATTYKHFGVDRATGDLIQCWDDYTEQFRYRFGTGWLTSNDSNATWMNPASDKVGNSTLRKKVIRLADGKKYAVWGILISEDKGERGQFRVLIPFHLISYCRYYNLPFPFLIGYERITGWSYFRLYRPDLYCNPSKVFEDDFKMNEDNCIHRDNFKITSSLPIDFNNSSQNTVARVPTFDVDTRDAGYMTFSTPDNKLIAQVPVGINGVIPDVFDPNKTYTPIVDPKYVEVGVNMTATVTVTNSPAGFSLEMLDGTIAKATKNGATITITGLQLGQTSLKIKFNTSAEYQQEHEETVIVKVGEVVKLIVPEGDIIVKEGQSVEIEIDTDADKPNIDAQSADTTIARATLL